MQVDIDTLMTWARAHAPYYSTTSVDVRPRRRVRLEITVEYTDLEDWLNRLFRDTAEHIVVARVYLAEPRCVVAARHGKDDVCECGPLAETRIG